MVNCVKDSAIATRNFYQGINSTQLDSLQPSKRIEYINALSFSVINALTKSQSVFEKITGSGHDILDIGDLVEKEMINTAKTIDDAVKRLEALMNLANVDLNVHGSILIAALAITNAIANLIKCASASQQEIVSQTKGTMSVVAFYKKNNKWSEGLLSAAKSVSDATRFLVEGADGLVNSTHSVEELIVAANEVGGIFC